ncbi:MAG: phage-shock protein [Nitrospiraceae bacterium]|nr:phage-shock protein [Nitrospiraceae bacterium]
MYGIGIGIAELAVIMVFLIPLAAVVGGIFLAALKILRGPSGKVSAAQRDEETRLIQDIYHGLQKMDERIEALETLFLEKERKDDNR